MHIYLELCENDIINVVVNEEGYESMYFDSSDLGSYLGSDKFHLIKEQVLCLKGGVHIQTIMPIMSTLTSHSICFLKNFQQVMTNFQFDYKYKFVLKQTLKFQITSLLVLFPYLLFPTSFVTSSISLLWKIIYLLHFLMTYYFLPLKYKLKRTRDGSHVE